MSAVGSAGPAGASAARGGASGSTTASARGPAGAGAAAVSAGAPAQQGPRAGGNASAGSAASGAAAAAGGGGTSAGSSAAAGSGGTSSAAAGGGGGGTGGGASGNAGRAGSTSAAGRGNEGTTAGVSPVFRIPLRVHTGLSELTEAELRPILRELNEIWLQQAGVCFEIEVTDSEDNREDGFDFRYTSGEIPIARGSNGVYQDPHSIWSIDHPRLNDVMMPVMQPTARTTAHELGHALGLAHENPPPSNDCSRPCHCVELGDDCDEYLMRSGSKGFFLSKPEIDTARNRAPRFALEDQSPSQCAEPVFMP